MEENLIIATGFSPWGEHKRNTSWDALVEATSTLKIEGWKIETRLIPVNWQQAAEGANEIVSRKPQAVVAFGQSSRTSIFLEQTAHRENNITRTDISGAVPNDKLSKSIPAFLNSTLPLEYIAQRLIEKKMPVELSQNAGDYLCNFLFYRILLAIQNSQIDSNSEAPAAGFIHVPEANIWPDSKIAEAVRITILATTQFAHPDTNFAD